MSLQDDEGPIDAEISNLLIAATPQSWHSARLDVEFSRKADGTEGFVHRISSPEGHRDLVEPPEEMYAAVFLLFDLFRRAGKPWQRVGYVVSQATDGNWDYEVRFEY